MLTLGPIGFVAPWLLLALLGLPILWWLLRAIPPRPVKVIFAAVGLLLGLKDREKVSENTPLWLLLLRVAAIATAILAFAGPVFNPTVRISGEGPLLVLVDASWAMADDWDNTKANIREILQQAQRDSRPVALVSLTEPLLDQSALPLQDPAKLIEGLPALVPQPWAPDRQAAIDWLAQIDDASFETSWFADGLKTADDSALFTALTARGPVTLFASKASVYGLSGAEIKDNTLTVQVLRSQLGSDLPLTINAIGADLSGIERLLGQTEVSFASDEYQSEAQLEMPVELRNRVSRLDIQRISSVGAVVLLDDATKRRKVGLLAGAADQEEQQFNAPLFYLRKALAPTTELIEASLQDMLLAAPDVLILADIGTLTETERNGLTDWVKQGGLLLRFAGPRLAQSGAGQLEDDPLLPVRLRAGGRNATGAMTWGDPKKLRAFTESSPFDGLVVPSEILVSQQVIAQPDAELPAKVLASLEDGTPLVTARSLEEGRVVLFHVTANAEWSNLPLSGLFVQMLQRLAVSARSGFAGASDLDGQTWVPTKVLNGFGQVVATDVMAGVPGERLSQGEVGRDAPPGIYFAGERSVAINLLRPDSVLAAMAPPPSGVFIGDSSGTAEKDLKPWLLLAALVGLMADILATLWLAGTLQRKLAGQVAILALMGLLKPMASVAWADDTAAILAANETVLAYVKTGDAAIDEVSYAGLSGLTRILVERTAIEPVEPVAIDLEQDELAFYPFLYWPISELQQQPSAAASAKLNEYLRTGGLIFFDTRDANLATGLGTSPNGRVLQKLVANLDIPPLEPIPADHVLTRTFYLLQEYPGRWSGAGVWVEAAANAKQSEGMPFRNLNDGVSPVIVGGNDWAAAWALSESGQPMFSVGRGVGGERQREIAWRFGVNIIMYVMTGNYKSDQVHVPALLERLGQ